jgi:hypothetical protein
VTRLHIRTHSSGSLTRRFVWQVILNGAIHTVMYAYYFLSMHTKDIWWKKYLTLMQITQFLAMNSQVNSSSFLSVGGDS